MTTSKQMMLAMSTRSLLGCRFAEWHHPRRRGSLPKTPECQDERSKVGPDVSVEDTRLGEGWKWHSHRTSPFGALFGGMACSMAATPAGEMSLTGFPPSFDSAAGGGVSTKAPRAQGRNPGILCIFWSGECNAAP